MTPHTRIDIDRIVVVADGGSPDPAALAEAVAGELRRALAGSIAPGASGAPGAAGEAVAGAVASAGRGPGGLT